MKKIGLTVALFLCSTPAQAAGMSPYLWDCHEHVTVNKKKVDCARIVKGGGLRLKQSDLVEVVKGRATITGWEGQLHKLNGKGATCRVGPKPSKPSKTIVAHLSSLIKLLFGGNTRKALLKSNGEGVSAKVVRPKSLTMTNWHGQLHWEVSEKAVYVLRVWAGNRLLGEPRFLSAPSVDLAKLKLGKVKRVTFELLLLERRPSGKSDFLRRPARLLLDRPHPPIRAALSTQLVRMTKAERREHLSETERSIEDLASLQRAAVLMSAGEIERAREQVSNAFPEGAPEAWAYGLSGVDILEAP